MTNEERDIISQFIARVGGAQAQSSFSAGSVPATQAPALPPIDQDADQFIAQNFQRYPEARYRITQLAFVQDHALVEAQNRIKRLEWELQQAQAAAPASPAAAGAAAAGGALLAAGSSAACSAAAGNRRAARHPAPPGPGDPWGQQTPPQQGYYQPTPGHRRRNTRPTISRACSSGRVPGSSVPR